MIMPKKLANSNNNRCKHNDHFYNEDLLNFKKHHEKNPKNKPLNSKNHHLNNCRGEREREKTNKSPLENNHPKRIPNKY